MKITPGKVEAQHVLLTGPITGTVTLADGTVVDVSPPILEMDADTAAEVAHLIGLHWAENGHPDDREPDAKGNLVQRPFEYDDSHYKAAKKRGGKKG